MSRITRLCVTALGALACACTATPPPQSALREASWVAPDARIEVLKVQMTEFFNRFGSTIALASERIAEGSEDAEVRQRALLWKSRSIALAGEATFRPDPLSALFDTWCLCAQMKAYLSEGPGRELFGEQRAIALAALDDLEDQVRGIAEPIMLDGDLAPLQELVARAVEEHPIEGTLLTRTSTVADHAELATQASSLTDVAANVDQKLSDINRHLTTWMAWLPEHVRWQAELLVADDLGQIAAALERVSRVAERLPDLAREERRLVLDAVDLQVRQVLDTLTGERVALTELATNERQALVAAIDQQRFDTIQQVTRERIAVIESIREERALAVAAVTDALATVFPRTERLVDHAVERLAVTLAVVVAAGSFVVFVALRWRRQLFGFGRGADRTPS